MAAILEQVLNSKKVEVHGNTEPITWRARGRGWLMRTIQKRDTTSRLNYLHWSRIKNVKLMKGKMAHVQFKLKPHTSMHTRAVWQCTVS